MCIQHDYNMCIQHMVFNANKVHVIALIHCPTAISESINLNSSLHLKDFIVPIVHHIKVWFLNTNIKMSGSDKLR